ncbi:hypothetical protein AABM17_393 [Neisseria musculi]|uniref:Uncharacterized protein n=1 Tax=Neisseria musculi TaxID=1815583 RepID=A0A7H1M830_9NEIS|nr:hypothetical protein H7A79_0393 [Neisseria musculi]
MMSSKRFGSSVRLRFVHGVDDVPTHPLAALFGNIITIVSALNINPQMDTLPLFMCLLYMMLRYSQTKKLMNSKRFQNDIA